MDTTLWYLTGCDWSFVKAKRGIRETPEGKQWLLSEETGEWALPGYVLYGLFWIRPQIVFIFFVFRDRVPLCNLLNNLKVHFCGVKCSHFIVPFKFCCAHLVAMQMRFAVGWKDWKLTKISSWLGTESGQPSLFSGHASFATLYLLPALACWDTWLQAFTSFASHVDITSS